jgi:hypothetical protein
LPGIPSVVRVPLVYVACKFTGTGKVVWAKLPPPANNAAMSNVFFKDIMVETGVVYG